MNTLRRVEWTPDLSLQYEIIMEEIYEEYGDEENFKRLHTVQIDHLPGKNRGLSYEIIATIMLRIFRNTGIIKDTKKKYKISTGDADYYREQIERCEKEKQEYFDEQSFYIDYHNYNFDKYAHVNIY